MATRTRDKQREALRDLDKGLTHHVGSWTHFLKKEEKKKGHGGAGEQLGNF